MQAPCCFYTRGVSREYGQFCGLARALEILDGRWTLLVVRDLLTGPKRFTELQQGLPGIPSNVLSSRLRHLEASGVVARQLLPRGVAYALTDYGRDLEDALIRLGLWGARTMGPRRDGEVWSRHSMALALRGAFRPDRARHADGVYQLTIDGQTLRVSIADGEVSFTSETDQAPDVVFETDPDSMYQLLTGTWDIDNAIATDHMRITGDVDSAHRFFNTFRLAAPIETPASPD